MDVAAMGQKSGITRQLLASPVVAGLAREQVSRALREWGLPFLESDAVLVMGELAANAIAASGRR
ncbi:hypothetical protein E1298_43640, partial [Actinomadura rubrisoli]